MNAPPANAPPPRRLGLITFGCKVNQYESAFMAESAAAQGFILSPHAAADILLVNTCTVTARADRQVRQTLRQAASWPSRPHIFVTGCYAQRAPLELAGFANVRGVLGNLEKSLWPLAVHQEYTPGHPCIQVSELQGCEHFTPMPISRLRGHTRAMIKIQDGCNQFCSYCIVPLVRGPERSLPEEEVLAQVQTLAAGGYQEIVLTGINLSRYGQSQPGTASLLTLSRRLRQAAWPLRVRFSSLEPQDLTLELLRELAAWPQFCPHFHLSLQSGAPSVLTAMHRPYQPQGIEALIHQLRDLFPTAALGLDVLVGFPTETPADFDQTRRFLERLPVSYLHVFPYSPRPGTPAAEIRPLSHGRDLQVRAKALRDLGERKKRAFYHQHLGKTAQVLVEGPAPGRPGWLTGLTPNYLRVHLPGPPEWSNRSLRVRLLELTGMVLQGKPLPGEEGS